MDISVSSGVLFKSALDAIGSTVGEEWHRKFFAERSYGSELHRQVSSDMLADLRRVAELDKWPKDESVQQWIQRGVPGSWRSMIDLLAKHNYDERVCDAVGLWVNEGIPTFTGSTIWASYNYPVFDLTQDFFLSIAITDFGDSSDDVIKLPFPAFVLRLPENTLLDNARSIFIHPSLRPYVRKFSDDPLDDIIEALLSLESASNWCIRAALPLKDHDALLDFSTTCTISSLLDDEKAEKASVASDSSTEKIKYVRRVLGNLLTYINVNGGLPAEGAKKLGPRVPVEREHKDKPRFRVGRPIKLGKELRRYLTSDPSGKTWELERGFVVRGHWKNNVYGKRLPNRCETHFSTDLEPAPTEGPDILRCKKCGSLRKRLFVEPFWKGPKDLNEALERTYSVEVPDEDPPSA